MCASRNAIVYRLQHTRVKKVTGGEMELFGGELSTVEEGLLKEWHTFTTRDEKDCHDNRLAIGRKCLCKLAAQDTLVCFGSSSLD